MARNHSHVLVLLAALLVVALGGYDLVRALVRPEVVAGMPTTLKGAAGFVSGRDHDHIWVGFGVEAPAVALTNVALVANSIIGLQNPQAFVVPMSALMNGDVTDAPRMSTIPKGRTFAVVIVGLPTCEIAPAGQSILVQLFYDAAVGPYGNGIGRGHITITGPAESTDAPLPYSDLCG